ncbi:FUSC family protein [Aquabacter sp. L1I39]|uniref:FUSC family protein n=1 Tax=Aquabacter sp. L1I39 TaxID=2820278 RepID=UPI001ADA5CDE|nr:FUSC family protein [Aquabacter sp. L1I39]QTL02723.1 FUSC family protein [Aquabacter sp. L1I39]
MTTSSQTLRPPPAGVSFNRLAPLPASILFAVRTALTALLALYIAFAAGLERPAWAMVTVFILSQPISGAVISKSLYRACGTLVGALFTVLMVPALVDTPGLLILAFSLWMGLCLYLAVRDRSPRAYAFTLAGYTSAIIGFGDLDAPYEVFYTALARIEEIGVGLLCATLASALVVPQTAEAAARARLGTWLSTAHAHLARLLALDLDRKAIAHDERKLAAEIAAIHSLMIFVSYEPSAGRAVRECLRQAFDRMLILLETMAEIRDRLVVLKGEGGLDPALSAIAARMADWLKDLPAADPSAGQQLEQALDAYSPAAADLTGATALNLAARLRDTLDLGHDFATLWLALRDQKPVAEADLRVKAPRSNRALPAIDFSYVVRTALALVLGIWIIGAFWIYSAWPAGAQAIIMVSIITCVTAAQQDQVQATLGFVRATLIAIVGVFIYQFGLLPLATDFFQLSLLVLPALLAIGLMVATPSWNAQGVRIAIIFTALLGLENIFSQDLAAFLNNNLAVLIGMGVVAVMSSLLRSRSPRVVAARLLRAGWRDIAAMATAPGGPARDGLMRRMVDRLGLMAPVKDTSRTDEAEAAFAAAFAARGMLDLSGIAPFLAEGDRRRIEDLVRDVGTYYRQLAAAGGTADPAPVLATLDGLRPCALPAPGSSERQAMVALVTLRRGLLLGAETLQAAREEA